MLQPKVHFSFICFYPPGKIASTKALVPRNRKQMQIVAVLDVELSARVVRQQIRVERRRDFLFMHFDVTLFVSRYWRLTANRTRRFLAFLVLFVLRSSCGYSMSLLFRPNISPSIQLFRVFAVWILSLELKRSLYGRAWFFICTVQLIKAGVGTTSFFARITQPYQTDNRPSEEQEMIKENRDVKACLYIFVFNFYYCWMVALQQMRRKPGLNLSQSSDVSKTYTKWTICVIMCKSVVLRIYLISKCVSS